MALGLASGIAISGALAGVLSADDMARWGWRVPFLLALPLGVVGLSLRAGGDDARSTAPEEPAAPRALREVWRAHGRSVRTGFLMVGVLVGTFNVWFVFLPRTSTRRRAHHLSTALGCAAAGLLAAAGAAPVLGLLSDSLGRRRMLVTGMTGVAVLVAPLYALATAGSWFALLVADLVMGVLLGSLVVGAHVAESFPGGASHRRALTYGMAAALVGGPAPLLSSVMAQRGHPFGLVVFLVALSLAGLAAAVRAPGAVGESAGGGGPGGLDRPGVAGLGLTR